MKLYATVTSERASKGQGGNDYLMIDIATGTAKNSNERGTVTVRRLGDAYQIEFKRKADGKTITLDCGDTEGVSDYQISGDYCSKCKLVWEDHLPTGGQCPQIKGEQKTGECPKCDSTNCEIRDNGAFYCRDCNFLEY